MDKNYHKLTKIFNKYYILNQINGNLSWDSQVKMPKNGFYMREKQIALLNQEIRNTICSQKVAELFANVQKTKLTRNAQRNFSLMQKIYAHKNSVPNKLQEEFDLIALKTEFIWPEARENNDFKFFDKHFSKLVKLLKEICQIKSEKMNLSKYETLLDLYSPGTKEDDLEKIFAKLALKLPNLIDKIISKQNSPVNISPNIAKITAQKKLLQKITKKIGINNNWCQIDETAHPFCSGYKGDIRITTKYDKNNFSSALMAIIHESGHALYDNNLPKKYITQPIGQDAGMALHESQSLFYEMQIARSMSFCNFIINDINQIFNLSLTSADLYKSLNFVKKDYIRINSDEVTYPLHIILRYNIERDLINNRIKTSDIPEIWSDETSRLFQIKAPNNKMGCLQDIHWSDGSLGYFPTYSIGAIYASQIAKKIKNIIDFDHIISHGKFAEINKILKENIQKLAHSKNAEDIIQSFCGSALDVDCYVNYLEDKFLNEPQI